MGYDNEEFTMIFNELYPNLCRFLESVLGRSSTAQDIAQESFLRLYRAGPFPPGEARFWLFRVARNLALNDLRNANTRAGILGTLINAVRTVAPGPEETYEQDERTRLLLETLQFLPEHQRAALLLREHEDMSYLEIAQVLNISEGKVKTDIFRARSALRDQVEEMQRTFRVMVKDGIDCNC
jgi:RNA polymerase sigma-70 factor (ECF subfamily)